MSITGDFISARVHANHSGSQSRKTVTDYLNSHQEFDAKGPLKKRNIFKAYIDERTKLIAKMNIEIDYKRWDGMSKEAIEYRSTYNAQWREIYKYLIEINRKYIPLFTAEKKRCLFCGKFFHAEDVIAFTFQNVIINFCKDDHMLQFNALDQKMQDKLFKKHAKV